MQISRAALGGAIEEAHKRGMKVTGHLCSVTYSEAADLGIDNLEHGFLAATDFVADKQPDVVSRSGPRTADDRGARRERRAVHDARQEARRQAGRVDVNAHRVRDLHAGTPDAARARGAHAAAQAAVRADPRARLAEQGVDLPPAVSQGDGPRACVRTRGRTAHRRHRSHRIRAASSRASRISGRSSCSSTPASRPLEAITIGTLNGARYLGRESSIGSIAAGKQADLVVLNGDPSATIADVRKVEIVFRQGIGYDPAKLIESVAGRVGLF